MRWALASDRRISALENPSAYPCAKDGKIGTLVKRAALIRVGATALHHIRRLGNDMWVLDYCIGNCGKDGQWMPVGVAQTIVFT